MLVAGLRYYLLKRDQVHPGVEQSRQSAPIGINVGQVGIVSPVGQARHGASDD
jgi:hypothetical protein